MTYEKFTSISRVIATGLAAMGGIMAAAFVSGLPGVQCKALARIYIGGIQMFGLMGFSGVVTLASLARRDPSDRTEKIMINGMLCIGLAALIFEAVTVNPALYEALTSCWRG